MGCSQFFTSLLVMSLLTLYNPATAQNEPPTGFNGSERDALLALLPVFNNPFLNRNWTSLMCYKNNPPRWYGIQCVDGRVTGIVLENMGLTGKIRLDALVNLTQLSVLSFKNNSILGNVMDFSYNNKLTRIDLSSNVFNGPIPDSLLTLELLESLQLQDNMLTGTVPAFNQFSLREVNVSNNALSGPIPNTTVLRSLGASSFAVNPGLCGPPSSTRCHITNNDTTNARPGSAKPSSASTFVIIDVIGLVIVVVLFIIYCRKSRKLKKEKKKGKVVEQEEAEKDVVKSVEVEEKSKSGGEEKGRLRFMNGEAGFELDDLLKASAEGLGKGNFGNCYKATMDDGATMVVRRLRELKPLSRNEFEKHLEAMADLRHPNLLPLVGYYYSREEKLLVYKFASFGNVYDRLHGGRGTRDRIPFRWSARLSVAHAVARALHYLHVNPKSSQPIVPHGNLKSSNVLLGDNDSVLVSDYGLTSLIAIPIAAHRMVAYKSPEYQNYKRVSNKSDVWSYGYLLLELLTGRVSSHAAPQGVNGVDLGGWVHRAVREEWTAEIFDVEIAVQRSANQAMLRLLELAIRCCDKSPERRPEMGEVVREVESVKVVADSEDEDELSSLTDDSVPATPLRS